jgi:hypothetical protein
MFESCKIGVSTKTFEREGQSSFNLAPNEIVVAREDLIKELKAELTRL